MNVFSSTSAFKQAGFTLLEILIAISLLAFITIGVVNITDNAANTKERTTAINENNLQIETAMSRLEWDISQIYSPLYFSTVMNFNQNNQMVTAGAQSGQQSGTQSGQQSGTQSGVQSGVQGGNQQNNFLQNASVSQYYETLIQRFERNEHFKSVSKEGLPIPRFYAPDKSTLEFFTSSNRRKVENQKQSHFAWVKYALANQDQTPEEEQNAAIPKSLKCLVRYFSADDPYGDKRLNIDNVDHVKGAVLLRNVETLEFQYWDYQRRRWETTLRNIQDGESIIRGVKVIISWYDSFGNKKVASRVFRTLWPMVQTQDQGSGALPQAGAQSGQQDGQQAGQQSGQQSGTQSGAQGNINSGQLGF
jgi:prepilin-type N-terminal cleavage/methylation domain-containing protein